ncbi:hypothetical protein [Mycobacterium sp. NS-7484]|uniref:hypothetical protein n=1 Tax=Mycobacterium sp. NS-7484 TaxID=1834161 RepID=UPI00115413DE|nr:hypothetical protein [Mycobacterium sp. NS-7484]
MTRVAAWVGAGVFTAGISAAMLAGAGTAHADQDGGSKKDAGSAATHNDSSQRSHQRKARTAKQRVKAEVSGARAVRAAKAEKADKEDKAEKAEKVDKTTTADAPERVTDPVTAKARTFFRDDSAATVEEAPRAVEVRVRPPISIRSALTAARERVNPPAPSSTPTPATEPEAPVGTVLRAAMTKDQADAGRIRSLASTAATPSPRDPLEPIHDVLRSLGALALNPEPQQYPKPLSLLGDVIFDTLATLERVVGGDPVIPPGLRDSVQVSTSTLVISEGHEVESNWYVPTTQEGQPAPTRMIYLQHGFLANGPLYSYTASYLAHSTNSIVVTTTFTSNPFEADGMWLGGDNLHEAVAQLFLDPDRTALNASLDTAELKAGRTGELDVPLDFVLVGHSLGGGFAPGVAGYYAEGLTRRRDEGLEAPNHLAGVVTYDAVPMGSIVPDAMSRLDELETNGTLDPSDDDPNDYIPIYEIGAPLNFLNVFSDVNDQLSEARPGQFTGVVLEDGVHMDPMQGGNPLIQTVAYLVAGFPQPQNPLAVRELSSGWINDMFDEKIDPKTGACQTDCAGQYGDGDDTFTITTAEGNAVAVLIGTQKATDLTSLSAISLTDFISAIPAGVLNGLETTCDLFSGGRCVV